MNASSVDSFDNIPDSSNGNYIDEEVASQKSVTPVEDDGPSHSLGESQTSGGESLYADDQENLASYGDQEESVYEADYAGYSEDEETENVDSSDLKSYQDSTGALWVRYWSMDQMDLNKLKESGVKEIFLESVALTDPRYQSSATSFLKRAQDAGIRVSAWVNCFKPGSTWINPADPSSATYVTNLVTRIGNLTRMEGIDGVHLDYIRYPGTAYKHAQGTASITSFVSQVNDVVKAIKPDALLSAALMPERGVNAYYYGQDYSQLAKHLDVLVPMIYKGNYNSNTAWIGSVTSYIVNQSSGTPVWAGILSYQSDSNVKPLEAGELFGDVLTALENGADGYVLFRYGLIDQGFFDYSTQLHNPTAGDNSNHSISFTPNSIKDAAHRMMEFIETNQRLPHYITINQQQVTMSEYLYLLANNVLRLNSGSNHLIRYKNINEPRNPTGDPVSGTLTKNEYVDIARRLVSFMDSNGRAPNFASSNLGQIRFETLVHTLTKVVNFAHNQQRLPNFVTVEEIDLSSSRQGNNPETPPAGNSISLNSILDAANRVNTYISNHQQLPKFVTINNQQLSMADFLYIMSQATIQLNSGNQTSFALKSIRTASNSQGNVNSGNLLKTDYLDLAQRLVRYMDSHNQMPNFALIPQGTVKSEGLVSVFSRILNFQHQNNRLPNFVSINNQLNQIQNEDYANNPSNPVNPGLSSQHIQDAARRVTEFITNNQRLPNYVNINNQSVPISDFLYLLTKHIVQSNSGVNTNIPHLEVKTAVNPEGDTLSGNLDRAEYLDVAQRVMEFIENHKLAPNFASSSKGRISYDGLIYMFARIVNFQNSNQNLPNHVVMDSLMNRLGSGSTSPGEVGLYLGATLNCQVNHASIQSLARSLTSGINSTWGKAEAIFNWTRDNISYQFYYNTRYGAVNTLSQRRGNCVDQSHLLIALSRAAGIPARYAHGICTFNSGSTYGHVWAELYINGKWHAADPVSVRNSLGVIRNWNTSTVVMRGRHNSLSF